MKLIVKISDREYENCKLSKSKGYTTCVVDISTILNATPLEESEDCVSRQAAINVAVDAVDDWDGGCNKTREEYIRKALETIPPVTPKQRVGRWVSVNPMVDTLMCSECGENIISAEFKSNYCPKCGAKMGGEQE